MKRGYTYFVELAPTAQTAAKTLLQIKAGAAALQLISVYLHQITKTSSELLEVQIQRKSAAATVTSATPLKMNPGDPASLAVGSTSGTGTNASSEGTAADILHRDIWNVLNGSWLYMPTPEGRIWVPQTGIIAVRLNTAPAASMTIGVTATWEEYV